MRVWAAGSIFTLLIAGGWAQPPEQPLAEQGFAEAARYPERGWWQRWSRGLLEHSWGIWWGAGRSPQGLAFHVCVPGGDMGALRRVVEEE